MDSIEDKLANLENQFTESQSEPNEQIAKTNKNTQSSHDFEPKMTQEQANAIVNVAKDPNEFINVKLSQKTNDLIENDVVVSQQFTELAKDTVQQSIETFTAKNKKQSKKNFFELNEKDVISLGGDKTSTKGQQLSIVLIKRFFWILFMSTLGIYYIAPMSVSVELFQGISFKNVEKLEYANGKDTKTAWVVKRHQLGIVGTIVGWMVGLGFWALMSWLIFKATKIFMIISICIFGLLLFINLFASLNYNKIFRKFEKKGMNNNERVEIEVEEDD